MELMQKRKNLYLVLDLTQHCSQNDILHAYNRAKTTYSRDSLASYSLYDDNTKKRLRFFHKLKLKKIQLSKKKFKTHKT